MADEPTELQFDRAERPAEAPQQLSCTGCSAAITHEYFERAGQIYCPACRERTLAERERGSRLSRFARATLFGGGAAIVGALLWFGIAKLTGYEFSLISIVIGFMVGGAVRLGCRRRGGWLYQGLAMFLTYTAIVSTYIPAIVGALAEAPTELTEEAATGEPETGAADGTPGAAPAGSSPSTATLPETAPTSPADPPPAASPSAAAEAAADPTAGASAAARTPPADAAADAPPTDASAAPLDATAADAAPDPAAAAVPVLPAPLGIVLGIALLFALAFAAPFLAGFENFMGWIILAIGLYEAWKLNRREVMVFDGPFRLGASRSAAPSDPPPHPSDLQPGVLQPGTAVPAAAPAASYPTTPPPPIAP